MFHSTTYFKTYNCICYLNVILTITVANSDMINIFKSLVNVKSILTGTVNYLIIFCMVRCQVLTAYKLTSFYLVVLFFKKQYIGVVISCIVVKSLIWQQGILASVVLRMNKFNRTCWKFFWLFPVTKKVWLILLYM